MTTDQLFNSFCLVGKITTVHADQIKDQLKEQEKRVREEVEKKLDLMRYTEEIKEMKGTEYANGWQDAVEIIIGIIKK